MKKFLFFCATTIVLASNALAQLEVVQCTEDDYKKGILSIFYCSCIYCEMPDFSPADNARMDSVLRHHFLAAEGYDDTVHYDLSTRLPSIDYVLYRKVKRILEQNFEQKSIRGGLATQKKYKKMAQNR